MKFVALVSGGKDSILSLTLPAEYGHECVALGHIAPHGDDEDLDSFMYQSVGSSLVPHIARCLQLPLHVRYSAQESTDRSASYTASRDHGSDEVEDLYRLLSSMKKMHPSIEGVSSGAIFSTYQRCRVESVCVRLGLIPLSYLWRRPQPEVLSMICDRGIDARTVKVAAAGLDPNKHLMKPLVALRSLLEKLSSRYGLNVAGEGGEYETVVLDAPNFMGRVVVDDWEIVVDSEEGGGGHARVKSVHVEPKDGLTESNLPQPPIYYYSASDAPDSSVSASLSPPSPPPPPPSTSSIYQPHSLPGGFFSFPSITAADTSKDALGQALEIFDNLSSSLATHDMTPQDVLSTHLYLSDISDFASINGHYSKCFGISLPPSRSCVGVGGSLNDTGALVSLDVFAQHSSNKYMRTNIADYEQNALRHVLHVQGLSSWAPVCVGPYSQANTIRGSTIFMAGMIGLQPETMTLLPTWESQLKFCWRHAARVLNALSEDQGGQLIHALGALVYVEEKSAPDFAAIREICRTCIKSNAGEGKEEEEGELWDGYEDEDTWLAITGGVKENQSTDDSDPIPFMFVVVDKMPKGALIEIELVCATNKAASFVGLQTEDVSTDATSRKRCCVSWPTGYGRYEASEQVSRYFDKMTITEQDPLEGVNIEARVRFVKGCEAMVWCEASGNGEISPTIGSLMRTVRRASGVAGMGIENVTHVRIYMKRGKFSVSEVEDAAVACGDGAAISIVPVCALESERLMFAVQATVLDLVHGETEMWVRQPRQRSSGM